MSDRRASSDGFPQARRLWLLILADVELTAVMKDFNPGSIAQTDCICKRATRIYLRLDGAPDRDHDRPSTGQPLSVTQYRAHAAQCGRHYRHLSRCSCHKGAKMKWLKS